MSNPLSFRLATWNVGSDGDYMRKDPQQPQSRQESDQKTAATPAVRNGMMLGIMDEIAADILCLQEVDGNRGRVARWLGPTMQFESDGRDTAVAWNTEKFKRLDSKAYEGSWDGPTATVVTLLHIETGKTVKVASTHLTGGCDETDGELKPGNDQLEALLAADFDTENNADVLIVGMDGNYKPHVAKRWKIITGRRFKRDTSPDEMHTNFYNHERKRIDYNWFKGSGIRPVHADSPLQVQDPASMRNPSDHSPVITEFRPTLWARIKAVFARIFSLFVRKAQPVQDAPEVRQPMDVLNDLFTELRARGLHHGGLFRTEASRDLLDKLEPRIAVEENLAVAIRSPHELAKLLARFVKSQDLIDAEIWTELEGIDLKADNASQSVSQVLQNIELTKRDQLMAAIHFLSEVAGKADENKMTPANLAICWSVNLMPSVSTLNIHKANSIVQFMIERRYVLFPTTLPR